MVTVCLMLRPRLPFAPSFRATSTMGHCSSDVGTRDLRLTTQLTRLKGAQPGQKGDGMDRTP